MSKHIVITVFGSLGDLHPMMALALALQARGHRVTIAAAPIYQEKIEGEGIGYWLLGPKQFDYNQSTFDELFDKLRGPEILIRKYLIPHIKSNYRELKPLLEKADFLINAPTVYAGPLLAETLKKPWAAATLQPFVYFSAYDPPVLSQLPVTEHWRWLGTGFWKFFLSFLKNISKNWLQKVYQFRKQLKLPEGGNPIFEGQFSPYLNLALFSEQVGPPQPDWPPHTLATGFAFYDKMKPDEQGLPPEVEEFLRAGEPPVVFTLGSSVVRTSTRFYEISLTAVKEMNCRAIFLAGDNKPHQPLGDKVLWWDAVAYSALFPHAAAVVHQGGMGTTAQVMRAGKPMLVVPHGFDQPDNAARVKRLGISRTIYPEQYTVKRVKRELSALLQENSYAQKAQHLGEVIRAEDGLQKACDAIEALL